MTTSNIGKEGFTWFLGVVEDLVDPLLLGRVRVRIFQEHDEEINTTDLPWAISMMPVTSASLAGVGMSPTSLLVGSYVMGFYIDGLEKQYPAVLATWHKLPEMDESKHDVDPRARGKKRDQDPKIGPEPDREITSEYPHNKVYKTSSGHVVEFDDTPNNERISISHPSGSYIEINKEGRFVNKIMGSSYKIVAKNDEIFIKGNSNVTIEGNHTVTVKGNINLIVDGNVKLQAGGKVDVTSSGAVNIKGSSIKLN